MQMLQSKEHHCISVKMQTPAILINHIVLCWLVPTKLYTCLAQKLTCWANGWCCGIILPDLRRYKGLLEAELPRL